MAARRSEEAQEQPPISPPAAAAGTVDASTTVPVSPDPEQTKEAEELRAPRCPDCHERMESYSGGDANPHKVGTAFCAACGRRRKVYRDKVVD